ncbi:MAG: hypothetical protein DWQ05_06345 [Calditrichaeota bacterium]|nr:MAG: hypothetical protein DWQ05_06345 [Calditrichota bacterium]
MVKRRIDELYSEYSSSMGVLEHQLKRLLDVKHGAEEKIVRIRQLTNDRHMSRKEMLQILSDRQNLINGSQQELRELENRRETILKQISIYSKEMAEAKKTVVEIEEKQEAVEHVIAAEQQNIEMTRPLVETLLVCRDNLIEEFNFSQKTMWEQYNARFAAEIERAIKLDQQRRHFFELLAEFRKDCTENPEVAFLWNKRKEWKEALKQIGTADIGQQIKNEIIQIEQDFEERYPGIMTSRKPEKNISIQSCLHRVELNGETVLVLPFSPETWQKIVKKSTDPSIVGLSKFFRSLIHELLVSAEDMNIWDFKGLLLLSLKAEHRSLTSISLQLPSGTEINIPCSNLRLLNFKTKFNGASHGGGNAENPARSNKNFASSNGLHVSKSGQKNKSFSTSDSIDVAL